MVKEDESPAYGSSRAPGHDLVQRTKRFALAVMAMVDGLPTTPSARVVSNQLLRAGTSVGANYRAARRGRSAAEFRGKLGIVEEEADECLYWLSLLSEGGYADPAVLAPLQREANEILSIMIASIRTSRRGRS